MHLCLEELVQNYFWQKEGRDNANWKFTDKSQKMRPYSGFNNNKPSDLVSHLICLDLISLIYRLKGHK